LVPALRLVDDPAAAKEEAARLTRRCSGEQYEMTRVVPPVVVVQPADDVPSRPRDRRRSRVDLAAPVVRERLDPRVSKRERRLDPPAVAVVDDDRLPVLPRLGGDAAQRPFEQTDPTAGGNDHGEMHVGNA